jgi:hypothetical protein
MSKRNALKEKWLDTVDAWDRLIERIGQRWHALTKRGHPPKKK